MLIIIVVAIFAWIGGYLGTTGVIPSYGSTQGKKDKIIYPPRFFFYLCGAPKSNKYPRGAMIEPAFGLQMLGIGLGVFSIVVNVWKLSKPEFIIGFSLSTLIPFLISTYVSRNYEIKVRPTKNKRA